MSKMFKCLVLGILVAAVFKMETYAAESFAVNDLIENASELDGKKIAVTGECIGEPMNRGAYTWVNINDGTNAMGIWMGEEDAESIETFGDYKHTGDVIQIEGIFNMSCSMHGGDMDVHSQDVIITAKGETRNIQLDKTKVALAAVSSLCMLLIAAFYFRNARHTTNRQ